MPISDQFNVTSGIYIISNGCFLIAVMTNISYDFSLKDKKGTFFEGALGMDSLMIHIIYSSIVLIKLLILSLNWVWLSWLSRKVYSIHNIIYFVPKEYKSYNTRSDNHNDMMVTKIEQTLPIAIMKRHIKYVLVCSCF